MLDILNQTFKGKKTYATAAAAIMTALITYLSGEATMMAALELAFTGILSMTIRNSVSTAVTDAASTAAVVVAETK
jgi:hypothetical protein